MGCREKGGKKRGTLEGKGPIGMEGRPVFLGQRYDSSQQSGARTTCRFRAHDTVVLVAILYCSDTP